MGNIKFFDGEMGTQLQSFKTHKADVLCLAIGAVRLSLHRALYRTESEMQDGTSVFTSGVDQKTAEFRLVSVSNSRSTASGSSTRWIQSSGRRLHSHDVRAMIMSPPYLLPLPSPSPSTTLPAPQVPILTSGGLDLGLVIVSASSNSKPSFRNLPLKNPVSETVSTEFETTIHRRCAFVPQRSRPFAIAAEARLLVCRRERSIGIWQLEDPVKSSSSGDGAKGWKKMREQAFTRRSEDEEEEDVESTPGWSKVVEMELKVRSSLPLSRATS